ncbi:hypothetical protein VCHA50P415_40189 [Vibrio chagasii]|nr:hypothetical protein VCHA27O13_80138 [Vibrio chagasii]CAH6801036.1 hypothetical protein VCHA29O37_100097 [Vibrio chagasii]CAH6809151.1 hypothetical protein VCHA32P90_130075 [Vibrio chagasii]CAH6809194.1 hypothetical protein VCHA34P112_130042 [Vibrio chagasii]CAH6810353.1 hypothetical protein VCHA35O137_130047 [Vibrio chagasii]
MKHICSYILLLIRVYYPYEGRWLNSVNVRVFSTKKVGMSWQSNLLKLGKILLQVSGKAK